MTQVTDYDADDYEPTWSPDGSQIAFSSINRGTTTSDSIWIVLATGGTPSLLTDDIGDDRQPAWSPDGSMIALSSHFRSDGTVGKCIWTVDVFSGAVEQKIGRAHV